MADLKCQCGRDSQIVPQYLLFFVNRISLRHVTKLWSMKVRVCEALE